MCGWVNASVFISCTCRSSEEIVGKLGDENGVWTCENTLRPKEEYYVKYGQAYDIQCALQFF